MGRVGGYVAECAPCLVPGGALTDKVCFHVDASEGEVEGPMSLAPTRRGAHGKKSVRL